jgi:hypothetical protein
MDEPTDLGLVKKPPLEKNIPDDGFDTKSEFAGPIRCLEAFTRMINIRVLAPSAGKYQGNGHCHSAEEKNYS